MYIERRPDFGLTSEGVVVSLFHLHAHVGFGNDVVVEDVVVGAPPAVAGHVRRVAARVGVEPV